MVHQPQIQNNGFKSATGVFCNLFVDIETKLRIFSAGQKQIFSRH